MVIVPPCRCFFKYFAKLYAVSSSPPVATCPPPSEQPGLHAPISATTHVTSLSSSEERATSRHTTVRCAALFYVGFLRASSIMTRSQFLSQLAHRRCVRFLRHRCKFSLRCRSPARNLRCSAPSGCRLLITHAHRSPCRTDRSAQRQ